jgi:hypothetical protein
MNCQEITRIADTGNFSYLDDAQRRAAELHALGCRHCAPVWATHARLAEQRIPPMPAELSLRCRTLAAAPVQASGRSTLRRMTLIGGAMTAVAAAAMLAVRWSDTETVEPVAVITAVPAEPTPPLPTPEIAAPVVSTMAAPPPAPIAAASEKPLAPLPLVPAPVYDHTRNQVPSNLALQKLVERHPELVEGPPTGEVFYAAIALYEDGRVYTSTVRPAPPTIESRDISAEVNRSVPKDGGNQLNTTFRKDTKLADGRALRADVRARIVSMGDAYDTTRSSLRVLQAMGDKYRDLMLPGAGGIMNRLTLFMTDDGRIEREHVERVGPPTGRTLMGSDANDITFLAESIAKPLGLDVAQIGLMGTTELEEGSLVMLVDASGNSRPDDQRRLLMVTYAWPRRAGETGPRWGQRMFSSQPQQPTVDPAAALAIVEREIPDAFRVKDPAAGTPTVILTAKGELIKTGRVQMRPGESSDKLIRDQLQPGIGRLTSFMTVRVKNARGEIADVTFTWEESPEEAKAREEALRKVGR